ncbi:MAG: hypothetical protein DRP47_03145 [Candidatus Zixiibacteriota bacterium]|nr:MAG: hypothetical protein DRP47_03145 [candidate division Zixibacteria bacterium]
MLTFVRRRGSPTQIVTLILLCIVVPATANSEDHINADIYIDNDSVEVWVDLSGLVSSERIELLKEGIDFALECRVDFLRPRRFWGSAQISQASKAMVIGYHLLAEEFSVTFSTTDTMMKVHRFASLAGLHHFLADSVEIPVISLDSIETDRRYYVEIAVMCISMTSLNIASLSKTNDTPLKFLFRQFLNITNYGREKLAVSSDLFRPSDLHLGR